MLIGLFYRKLRVRRPSFGIWQTFELLIIIRLLNLLRFSILC